MLREFTELMAAVPRNAVRDDYTTAIVDENVLGKRTHATRKSSRQRLSELYGLDPGIPLFRVLRHLWSVDAPGRPLLAFLCALARDPLLRATSAPVLALSVEEELVRSELFDTLREAVGPRMNDSILDKVVRNVASSWTQAGHLSGHVRKVRRRVAPTAGVTALALWLGEIEGRGGLSLLNSGWTSVLDVGGEALLPLVFDAKRLGLVQARVAGSVIEISARLLDPEERH